MFTGIIKEVTEVAAVKKRGGNLAVAVAKPAHWRVKAGESIAVNGICSTVTKAGRSALHFEYMRETLRKTTAGSWRVGTEVNLERSLRIGDALDGHLVMGHVDGTGTITKTEKARGSTVFRITPPRDLLRYIVMKGSVAIDGVSLTVVTVGNNFFTVALIPYTLSHTNLGKRRIGDRVNIETDILAKYAAKSQG